VGLEERAGSDTAFLVESALAHPRLALCGDLDRLDAAGRALRWVRRAAPPHTPEPALWAEINELLDALDAVGAGPSPLVLLAGAGLRMLAAVGWGLELAACVRCGKPCARGASAYVNPAAGGLVCRSCGGGPVLVRGERRERLRSAAAGEPADLDDEDVRAAIDLVEATLAAHA
jgi:DNA repair protein RecO (recombination protein O)